MSWDSVGWLANILLVTGTWQLGNRRRWAFLCTTFGELIWTIVSWKIGTYSMVFICIVFAILSLRNWLKWGDESHTPLTE